MSLFRRSRPEPDLVATQHLRENQEVDREFREGITALRDFIAPSSLEFNNDHIKVGTRFAATLYVYGFPREIYTGWLSPIINIDETIDISMFVYPVESRVVLENLRKKVGQLEAGIQINAEKGRVRDPGLEAAISDAEELRDKLQVGEERFFRFGLYLTLYADSLEELRYIERKIEGIFGQELVYTKVASLQMEQAFNSTLPQGTDQLQIRRNFNTGALSTSFPFTSADLSQENGILYGINMHNNGLVIFDRFSLENANMVVFAKSGAGKSFAIKLEALRSLMMGTQIIVIDPENEYERLCEAVGGSYVRMSLTSDTFVNPFDLPHALDEEEADNALRANLITLHGMLRLMLSDPTVPLTAQEEADLDLGLINTYATKGITNDPLTHNATPPVMNDLYETLVKMEGNGPSLAQRLRKYTSGTYAGLFSSQSNVDLDANFIVFNIRDLEDEMRPIAMYVVLNHVWNRVKSEMKKRYLIVDEAWQLMKFEDSANFLFSLAKRARKYELGLTTISQDVEDFLSSRMGRAVVANSSLQLLLKQSPSAVDLVADTFKLTSEETKRLSQFPVGQGLFFAGLNHVHIRIEASPTETQLITTNPQQLQALETLEQTSVGAEVANSLADRTEDQATGSRINNPESVIEPSPRIIDTAVADGQLTPLGRSQTPQPIANANSPSGALNPNQEADI